jgi:hypothetical protein
VFRSSRRKVIAITCAALIVGSLVGVGLTLAAGEQSPQLDVELYVQPEIMTAAYKAYSGAYENWWAAKVIATNTGTVPVRDFQITYEIPGMCEGGMTYDHPLILPGQSVRDFCRPTFSPDKMAALTSRTDAEITVTYDHEGLNKPKHESEKLVFLGRGDWLWTAYKDEDVVNFYDENSYAPVLAAFVTPREDATEALAKELTAGTYTGSDEGTMEALGLIFNGLVDRGYDYITESATFWSSRGGQNVQYPHDSIEHNGGNCVDLALLFSSLCEAVDIKTYLTLCTSHCFFAIQLPESGQIIPVEATAVGAGEGVTLDWAIDMAYEEVAEETAQGTFMLIDVREQWEEGMVPAW